MSAGRPRLTRVTTSVPPADLRLRLDRARATAAAAGVDALLVSPGPDLRYLTGYDAKPLERLTCLLLPAQGARAEPVLVVPGLERAAAQASGVTELGLEIVPWQETEDPYGLVAKLLPGVGSVALDNHMWAEKVLAFRASLPGVEQKLAGEVLRELRMRKTPAEVAELRAAGAAIDRVHARVGDWLRPGRTEAEVGRDIHDAILAEGHVQVDFVIVGSGPNGASPHHEVSDRVIQAGEPVVVDIGGTTAAGYCSDETRTYAVGGRPSEEFRRYYDVLQRAQEAACAHVRPGVTAESVDAVARTIITEAGYGEEFIHRTGHGIGMESHEEPYIVAGNTLPLEPGMAFSVEPGIYFEGRHGARIEDIVVVTETGVEAVNLRPRDLVVLDG
ncbi:Xaa-Pro aminopeptidase [Actinopolymorpha cephalotaxi]|uniref:Xaa-Pro aminopeptidase n=1 Tax=Actinopolymorpha cephalotaxi TaxID=504797 RepID=A0A1I2T936_9ACTN|nr:Xaa-Pro aminopeptidase [Actinopolymorpha cephalotaxi]